MKKSFINRLWYCAILGSTGCNYMDTRMGMLQQKPIAKDDRIAPTDTNNAAPPTEKEWLKIELTEIIESVYQRIELDIMKLNSMKEPLLNKYPASASTLELIKLALDNLKKEKSEAIGLLKKIKVEIAVVEKKKWKELLQELLPQEKAVHLYKYSDMPKITNLASDVIAKQVIH